MALAEVAKPPYRVPTMAEVSETPWNGLTVASLFAGCGGSSTGYRTAGYSVLWANEFVGIAADTYEANASPWTEVDRRDVREVQAADVEAACAASWDRMRAARGLDPAPWPGLDVLDGSPPCASFSTAGKRAKKWGAVSSYSERIWQRSDDLFFEFARVLGGLRPRAFVAENVSGLVKGVARGYFKEIHAALADAGYEVEARLLDAAWLGVPQHRRRVIFIGVRRDLAERGARPAFPTPLPYLYSMRDALPELSSYGPSDDRVAKSGNRTRFEMDRPAATVAAHGMSAFTPDQIEVTTMEMDSAGFGAARGTGRHHKSISLDEPAPTLTVQNVDKGQVRLSVKNGHGFTRKRLRPGDPAPTVRGEAGHSVDGSWLVEGDAPSFEGTALHEAWKGLQIGHYGVPIGRPNLIKPNATEPAPTIAAMWGAKSLNSITHPSQPRKLSIDECRALCGFPLDFVLIGNYSQQWERLGRAVPPPMMAAVAAALRDELRRCAE